MIITEKFLESARRKMSPEHREKLSSLMKERWQEIRCNREK